jgi:putative transposase
VSYSLNHLRADPYAAHLGENGIRAFPVEHEIPALQLLVGSLHPRRLKVRAKTGDPVTFRSALVPPYLRKTKSLEAALPWLYLKGISNGEMIEALAALVDQDAKDLAASTVAVSISC